MLFLIIIPVILFIWGVRYYANQIIYPNVFSHERTEELSLEKNLFDPNVFKQFERKSFKLQSDYGYDLNAEVYLNDPSKFIIISHGITNNLVGMKRFAKLFFDRGYSVFLYDHRNHGKSDRNFTSLGHYEKKDLIRCVKYIKENYQPNKLGLLGESMGAATALLAAATSDEFDFCIEDCGFSNAYDLFSYRAAEDHNKLVSLLTYPTSLYLKLFYRFDFGDISPIKYMNKIQCPVMFIHGDQDDYVPYRMLNELSHAFKGTKMVLTVEGADHANAVDHNYMLYQSKVYEFLDSINC